MVKLPQPVLDWDVTKSHYPIKDTVEGILPSAVQSIASAILPLSCKQHQGGMFHLWLHGIKCIFPMNPVKCHRLIDKDKIVVLGEF